MTDKIHGFIKVHSSDLVVPTLTVRSSSAGGMIGRMRWIASPATLSPLNLPPPTPPPPKLGFDRLRPQK